MTRRLIPYAGKNGVGGAKHDGPLLLDMRLSYEAAGISLYGDRQDDLRLKELLRQIPPDTRDLTGRLMGDPIPGDMRRCA